MPTCFPTPMQGYIYRGAFENYSFCFLTLATEDPPVAEKCIWQGLLEIKSLVTDTEYVYNKNMLLYKTENYKDSMLLVKE